VSSTYINCRFVEQVRTTCYMFPVGQKKSWLEHHDHVLLPASEIKITDTE